MHQLVTHCMHAAVLAALAIVIGATAAIAQPVASTPFDGFQGIWYEIGTSSPTIPNKYGGGLATYPQQIAPLAIYSPEVNRTYFTFCVDLNLGSGRNIGHAISYYDHATHQVARPQVWLNKGTGDAHDAAVLSIDDDGYLYMFSMTHGESRRSWIKKSSAPHTITASTDMLSLTNPADQAVFGALPGDSATTLRFSYAGAWYMPNAETDNKFLLMHTRYQSGNRDLFTTTSADGDVWTARKGLSQIESGQYQTSWIKPDGKTVGTIFDVHPSGLGSDHRTDLYYLETADQGQTWKSADGLTIVNNTGANNNPLMSRPDQPQHGATQVYNAAPGEKVFFKDVNYDSRGRPIIMFLTSPTHIPGDSGPPGFDQTVFTARWTGTEWSIKEMMKTDHNYDHGSLYVEGEGQWRVIAPFITGPQLYGTGGQMGMWTTADYGATWTLEEQLTSDSTQNHTYARRVLHGQDDFYAFWASGDAFEPSDVYFYFANKAGEVFRLPFNMTTDFAGPEPTGLSADYNSDARIDIADYVVWRDNLGSTTTPIIDGNHSGIVDFRDYQLWKMQFEGKNAGSGVAVPEPPIAWLLCLALPAALWLRSRQIGPVAKISLLEGSE